MESVVDERRPKKKGKKPKAESIVANTHELESSSLANDLDLDFLRSELDYLKDLPCSAFIDGEPSSTELPAPSAELLFCRSPELPCPPSALLECSPSPSAPLEPGANNNNEEEPAPEPALPTAATSAPLTSADNAESWLQLEPPSRSISYPSFSIALKERAPSATVLRSESETSRSGSRDFLTLPPPFKKGYPGFFGRGAYDRTAHASRVRRQRAKSLFISSDTALGFRMPKLDEVEFSAFRGPSPSSREPFLGIGPGSMLSSVARSRGKRFIKNPALDDPEGPSRIGQWFKNTGRPLVSMLRAGLAKVRPPKERERSASDRDMVVVSGFERVQQTEFLQKAASAVSELYSSATMREAAFVELRKENLRRGLACVRDADYSKFRKKVVYLEFQIPKYAEVLKELKTCRAAINSTITQELQRFQTDPPASVVFDSPSRRIAATQLLQLDLASFFKILKKSDKLYCEVMSRIPRVREPCQPADLPDPVREWEITRPLRLGTLEPAYFRKQAKEAKALLNHQALDTKQMKRRYDATKITIRPELWPRRERAWTRNKVQPAPHAWAPTASQIWHLAESDPEEQGPVEPAEVPEPEPELAPAPSDPLRFIRDQKREQVPLAMSWKALTAMIQDEPEVKVKRSSSEERSLASYKLLQRVCTELLEEDRRAERSGSGLRGQRSIPKLRVGTKFT